jgi:hypothetical protein
MKSTKHIGKLKNTGTKVLVAFRTVPGESDKALVIQAAQLPDAQHDAIMTLVETDQAQDAFEFGEILFTRPFPDGRPMLRALQSEGRLQKVPTDRVLMTPAIGSEISLDQLNVLIAEQKNCTVDDLCTFVSGFAGGKTAEVPQVEEKVTEVAQPIQAPVNQVLDDKDIAKGLRSQADSLYKEAARLRKQADDLDPPQKKTAKVKEVADA